MIGIVTGASAGIGLLFVEKLLQQYPQLERVWVIARRKEKLQELEQRFPGKIRSLGLDLSLETDREDLQLLLQKEKPKVKFLINCAGVGKIGDFLQIPMQEQNAMITVNIHALTAVTHMVIPFMPKNSRIIQIASVAAFVPQPGFSVYAASKAYVLSFSKALSSELRKKKIYVTAVCPGPMPTEFFQNAETYASMSPFKMQFMYSPEKVVEHAMQASIHKRKIAVYGLCMKILFVLCKLLPQDMLVAFMALELPGGKQ